MIQSMEILQLPVMALQERIEQEMQENETLELVETDPDSPETAEETENPDAPTQEERELVVDETKDNQADFERLLNMDEQWPEQSEERSRPSATRVAEEGDRQHDAMANMVDRPQSLQDHLHEQLGWFDLDEPLRQMCDRIIYNLDSNGYMQGRLEDLVDSDGGPQQLALAQKALATVQRLDPAGVGARDLRECWLLQLSPAMPLYEPLQKLIANHLEDLAHNRLPHIQRRTGYTIETIHDALVELRKLNPKPGAKFAASHVPTVTPDVFIEEQENGSYKVRLEDGRTPNLYISPYYRQLLLSPETDEKTREYIKRKINSAQWLIESIEQRRNTLTRVAQAIVDHQKDFLTKGPESIEPLKMQQIADKVGVHVTTVSRAVDDKWVQTPRGIFPLKRFFVGGTMSADGEEVAWDAVRVKLQEIVDHENKQEPFSDDDLVKELNKHGLTVARRTVTKYRKAMNIPSSRQRRDWTLAKTPETPPIAAAPVVDSRPAENVVPPSQMEHAAVSREAVPHAAAPHAEASPVVAPHTLRAAPVWSAHDGQPNGADVTSESTDQRATDDSNGSVERSGQPDAAAVPPSAPGV